MPTKELMDNLAQVAKEIRAIERHKLFRPELGEASLSKSLPPILEKIEKKLSVITRYSWAVGNQAASGAQSALREINNALKSHVSRSTQEYVNYNDAFIQTINSHLLSLEDHWPPFVAAEFEHSGLLSESGRPDYENKINQIINNAHQQLGEYTQGIQAQIDSAIKHIQAEADKKISEATQKAEQIQDEARSIQEKVRRTAEGVSISEAQIQFRKAQNPLLWQIGIWSVLSVAALGSLFCIAYLFLTEPPPSEIDWHVIYRAGIKITILAAIGSVAAYFLRILRAHIHMYQHNRHRQAIANSIEAFMAATATPEERALILSRLVESVASFGQSGLVHGESETIGPARSVIEAIPRVLSGSATKPPG